MKNNIILDIIKLFFDVFSVYVLVHILLKTPISTLLFFTNNLEYPLVPY